MFSGYQRSKNIFSRIFHWDVVLMIAMMDSPCPCSEYHAALGTRKRSKDLQTGGGQLFSASYRVWGCSNYVMSYPAVNPEQALVGEAAFLAFWAG